MAVNPIKFEYEGKQYCLEYNLESITQMESAGFSINDLADKPVTRIEQLWAGAFLANNKKTSATVIKALYKKMKNKEQLLRKLTELYEAALSDMMPDEDDEGNVEWTA